MEILPSTEVQQLAEVGLLLQYLVRPVMANITAVDLAAKLLTFLQTNETINNQSVLSLVAACTQNSSLDTSGAEDVLSAFRFMPTDRLHGVANYWIAINVLSMLFLIARLWSRHSYSGRLRRDDYILIVAWIIATVNNVEDTYLILAQNWEAHSWNATLHQILAHSKIGTADDFEYAVSTFLFKTALLIFFHDLYPQKAFRRATYVMFGVVTLFMLSLLFFFAFNCKPFDTWNHPFTTVCAPHLLEVIIFFTTFNIAVDITILLLPLTVIYKLNLKRSDKFVAMFLIGLGGITCLASILRYTTLSAYATSHDVLRRAIPITTWSMVEQHIGIVCACVPALRRLTINLTSPVTSKMPSYISSSFNSNSRGSGRKHARLDDMAATIEDDTELKIFKDVSCDVTSASSEQEHFEAPGRGVV